MYVLQLEDNFIINIYTKELNGEKECLDILNNGGIQIDEEMAQNLSSVFYGKFNGTVDKEKIFTMKDKNLFSSLLVEQPKSELELLKEKVEKQDKKLAIQEQTILELSAMLGGM